MNFSSLGLICFNTPVSLSYAQSIRSRVSVNRNTIPNPPPPPKKKKGGGEEITSKTINNSECKKKKKVVLAVNLNSLRS